MHLPGLFRFWPIIDDALRRASLERGVRVRVLASLWNHTKHDMVTFLRSLADVSGAMDADVQVVSEIRIFVVVDLYSASRRACNAQLVPTALRKDEFSEPI